LPVEDGATWDDTYPGIVRGWGLFVGTLQYLVNRVGALGRATEVRLGKIAPGAWQRVLASLGMEGTPPPGFTAELRAWAAEVLVSVDDYSLLLAFGDEATLLIDVEGDSLYTVAATYGDASPQRAELLQGLAALAEDACRAAGLPAD